MSFSDSHKCEDCGAIDSYQSNGDNHICTVCGSTEGYKEIDVEDTLSTFYCTLTQGGIDPNGYLKILAPSENIARIVARIKLDKNWAFIYPEEQFEGQIEKYNLHPLDMSPIIVTEDDTWYWKQKFAELNN